MAVATTATKQRAEKTERAENPMRKIRVAQVVLNIGSGSQVERLERTFVLAQQLTGRTPVRTLATRRARTFRAKRGAPIGVKVTLRGKVAIDFLKKVLPAVDNKIPPTSFDDEGNFAFGIPEYLDIPGMKYNPELGILGMNVIVALDRAGYRVKRRKIARQRLPRNHRITKQEAIEFVQRELGVKVTVEEE